MLDVIRAPEVGTQEIPTPPLPSQVALRQYARWRQGKLHLTASDPNRNPTGAYISIPGSTAQ